MYSITCGAGKDGGDSTRADHGEDLEKMGNGKISAFLLVGKGEEGKQGQSFSIKINVMIHYSPK